MDERYDEDRRRSRRRRQFGEKREPQRQREERHDGKHREKAGCGVQPRQHGGLILIRESNVRYRLIIALGALALLVLLLSPTALPAQNRRPPATPPQPTPRWPDGTPRLSASPGEKGLWHPNGRPILA